MLSFRKEHFISESLPIKDTAFSSSLNLNDTYKSLDPAGYQIDCAAGSLYMAWQDDAYSKTLFLNPLYFNPSVSFAVTLKQFSDKRTEIITK